MNSYFLAAILGVIEGLTEFLPISSTAHLRIVQSLLGLSLDDEYWKMFAIVIQLGAILSVLVYFRKNILSNLKSFMAAPNKLTHPIGLVSVAFVVTAIPAFLMRKIIGHNLESLQVIGWALFIGGFVMVAVEKYFKNPSVEVIESMTFKQSVWIGLVQILSAVFPGVSRSMSTIAAGQVAGLTRSVALEFSFYVSLPTMVAATVYDLLKSVKAAVGGAVILQTSDQWIALAIGFTVSFVVALAVIAWFMKWVRTKGFAIFAVYRVVVGALVLCYL